MRVAHCLDNLEIGGTETSAVRTMERLDRTRVESLLVYGAEGALAPRFFDAAAARHHAPLRSFTHPSTATQIWRLVQFFRRERVDVVHCHDVYDNVFATTAARLAGVPAIIASRRWGLTQYAPKLIRLNQLVGYRFAHRILANSDGVARSVVQDEGVPPERVTVIPNFVDAALFDPIDATGRTALRAELGLPADALVIGVVATVKPVKDPFTLLRAAAALAPGLPSLRLVFVGDGESRAAVQSTAAELGVADRVQITGMLPRAARFHHAFDVSALTSVSEGFPNSIVEAMAAARPVVATAVGGMSDAVVDGETGFLVPSGDIHGVRDRLARLLDEAARRRAMGERGRAFARERFHEEAVLPRLERLYAELLANAGRGAPGQVHPGRT